MRPYLLPHLLQASADARPDALAVVDGDRELTYRDLASRAGRLANLLVDAGVRPGDRVGVYLDKSSEAVTGLYAIMLAGAAYVPLDPDAPVARLAYILRDCGVGCLLSGVEKAADWAGLAEAADLATVVVLNAGDTRDQAPGGTRLVDAGALDTLPEDPPAVPTVGLDLAYILYTSGSTGRPKGVMLSHHNALAFVEWATDAFSVQARDRLSSHAPLHFDLSVFDLYAAAAAGAAVVLVPRAAAMFPAELHRFLEVQALTVWYSVPSVLTMLATRGGLAPGDLPDLRVVLFAGEVFPTKYLRALMALLPHARFANLYGPTETNVCTWHELAGPPADDSATVPIGRAVADDDVFAVTGDGRLAAPGETGELYVRGATVMRGYWGDAERSEKALVPCPLPGRVGPAYRTGDLVQQREDGAFIFLGRRDTQVKTRGYRVELGEIEAALSTHPGVVECAVVAVPDPLVTSRIKAFVGADPPVGEAELRQTCAERLPAYMIPEAFDVQQRLPRTSTGKIDRQSLSQKATQS